MSAERITSQSVKKEGKWLDRYKNVNIITMVAALLLIGGSVGVALATIDAAQIVLIEKYKKRKKGSK